MAEVQFAQPALGLVWNHDYSLKAERFSMNTLEGRVPAPFARQGMDRFFDGPWRLGTGRLIDTGAVSFLCR